MASAAVSSRRTRLGLAGLSWNIAARWPERLGSLHHAVASAPRSRSTRAMREDPEQPARSAHHKWLLEPGAEDKVLADDAHWVRARLRRNGVPEAAIEKHISVIGNRPAMAAAIGWYRARGWPAMRRWGPHARADAANLGRCRRHGRAHGGAEGTAAFIAAP